MNKTQIIWYQFQSADISWIKNNPGEYAKMIRHIKRYRRFIGLKKINP